MSYGALSSREILETLYRLRNRISERFPGCSLLKLSDQVADLLKEAQDRSKWVKRDLSIFRIPLIAFALIFPALIVVSFLKLNLDIRLFSVGDIFDCIQTVIFYILFIWAAFFYVQHLERRKRKRKVLNIFHKVRQLAHLIEMLQLGKDPSRADAEGKDTPSSPARLKDVFLLSRYRAYCKELLVILSKIPAIYSQHFEDAEVLSLVGGLETLCHNAQS